MRRHCRTKSSLATYRIEAEKSDPGVTAFAGLPVAIDGWHALGLDAACAEQLKFKARRRGPTEGEWTELAVMLRVAGGQTPADLRALQEDAGLCRLWELPSK